MPRFTRRFLFACLSLLLALSSLAPLAAQTINQAEFIDKPLREILATLGAIGGKSLVVDETVTGNATHYLTGKSFEQALQIVLETNRLHKTEANGVLVISRIKVESVDGSRFNVAADGMDLETLLRRVARDSQKTILYDPFPRINVDISLKAATIPVILNTLLAKLPGYSLETGEQHFYLRNSSAQAKSPNAAPGNSNKLVSQNGGLYSIHAKTVKLSEVLESLFGAAQKEYAVMKKGDAIIERLWFDNKEFEASLRLILEQADADYVVQNGLYYIVEVNRSDIVKKFETTRTIPLKYLSVMQLVNLMPGGIASGSAFKIDKPNNALILNGTSEETQPIVDFVAMVDKEQAGLEYQRFDLMNLSPEAVLAALPEGLKSSDPIVVKGQPSLILLLSPERSAQARRFIALIDKARSPYIIKLKYIKAEDLLAKLPSFIAKENLSMGFDQRYVFFNGSKEQYTELLNQLRYIDIPVPQIKYQVLVVQYQDQITSSLGLDFSRQTVTDKTPNPFKENEAFAILGSIGKTLQLNFDIVADLGYWFASALSASLASQKATVLLDTTLNGLSNQDVTFKNTNTYRIASTETNPDTGGTAAATKTITREIVSGITLTLKGWVSGDGMISVAINSSISRRGSGDANTNIPQTYDKLITTTVRTPSGQPIVVGGLMQHDSSFNSNTLYLGSDDQNTELMIYIIPRVETPLFYDGSVGDSLLYLYNQFAPHGERQDR